MKKQSMPTHGLAWFKEEDWPRLLALSEDRKALENTHSEWLNGAEKAIQKFEKQGIKVQKVPVTPDELLIWCNEQNIPINNETRTRFVAHKLQEKGKST